MKIEFSIDVHLHADPVVKAGLQLINHTLENIMTTQTEIVAQLTAAAALQEKTIGEIQTLQGTLTALNTTVAELQAIIAAGGAVTQELIDAANRVEALAKRADDEIPDVA